LSSLVHLASSFTREQVEGGKLFFRACRMLIEGYDLTRIDSRFPGPFVSSLMGHMMLATVRYVNFVPVFVRENVVTLTVTSNYDGSAVAHIYLNRGVRLVPTQWAAVIAHEVMHVALHGAMILLRIKSFSQAKELLSSAGDEEEACAMASLTVMVALKCGYSPNRRCFEESLKELESIPETPPSGMVIDELYSLSPAHVFELTEQGFHRRAYKGVLK